MSRVFIAAAHKSSGKTVVTTGLTAALAARGRVVQTFKKGPDYIDPMWLGQASGNPCYNLDFNTMERHEILAHYHSRAKAVNVIEANKGLFDGVDLHGADSNAELAKLLRAPVVLVIDTGGMTRGIAPLLQGYVAFDKQVNLAGVILNKVGGTRHESKLRAAVETYTDLPVIGAVGRNPALEIGERHLGLTTPAESGAFGAMIKRIGDIVGGSVDLERLESIAASAPPLGPAPAPVALQPARVRVGIPRDTAFGFYYPDDLEAMQQAGAELVFFNALSDAALPDVDGLFIGGGFPETQMQALAANGAMRQSIKTAVENGLPTYAECGGLMLLCRSLTWHGQTCEMVGVVPGDAVMHAKPQGRGYTRLLPTGAHPWKSADGFTAHEFHYARVDNLPQDTVFAYQVQRGHGIDGAHDGIVAHNMLAGFCHLRTTRANLWAQEFVAFVAAHKKSPA